MNELELQRLISPRALRSVGLCSGGGARASWPSCAGGSDGRADGRCGLARHSEENRVRGGRGEHAGLVHDRCRMWTGAGGISLYMYIPGPKVESE